MYQNQYYTITQKSILQANGPFAAAYTSQAPGNLWQLFNSESATFFWNQPIELDIHVLTSEIESSDEMPYAMMLASEAVLSKDWNTPEEDKAWENIKKAM